MERLHAVVLCMHERSFCTFHFVYTILIFFLRSYIVPSVVFYRRRARSLFRFGTGKVKFRGNLVGDPICDYGKNDVSKTASRRSKGDTHSKRSLATSVVCIGRR